MFTCHRSKGWGKSRPRPERLEQRRATAAGVADVKLHAALEVYTKAQGSIATAEQGNTLGTLLVKGAGGDHAAEGESNGMLLAEFDDLDCVELDDAQATKLRTQSDCVWHLMREFKARE